MNDRSSPTSQPNRPDVPATPAHTPWPPATAANTTGSPSALPSPTGRSISAAQLRGVPIDGISVTERLSVLAHDLNNMLDGTMRQLGIAIMHVHALPQAQRDDLTRRLQSINAALGQMASLIGTVDGGPISGEAGQAGQWVLTIGDAISHACAMFDHRAGQSGISIARDIAPAASAIPSVGLFCILINGIKNAIEALERTRRTGEIIVSARVTIFGSQERIVIEIADDGPGLDRNVQGRDVFAPGVTQRKAGLGLGLAIAKQAAAELGGTVELVTRPVGTGMCLRLVVPLDSLANRSRAA